MILEITFCSCYSRLFQNVGIVKMYIVAGDFGMLFNCGANIPFVPGLCLAPEISNFFYVLQYTI